MIKGTRNQLANSQNQFQGNIKKVLTVCSAGLLRSATMAHVLAKEFDYNVRNCGTEESYALIPISEALVFWADEIVFVNKENYNAVKASLNSIKREDTKVYCLDIPDMYSYCDPELIKICKEQYETKEEIK